MEALQYIYTSWQNGNLPEKGFMVYSKSEGITPAESDEIKFVMQYAVPRGLTPNPTVEEINSDFPYSFAYFPLGSGRVCVAQATYLGRDYSGRFGNYIIYALVIEREEMDMYPAELFAENYIKVQMTGEELSAQPPVPPLPPIDIDEYGSNINDEALSEFISGRTEQFAMLISAAAHGYTEGKPVYIHDGRENIVMWMAALHRIMPLEMAKNTPFTTYAGNHEKFSSDINRGKCSSPLIIGVNPDANGFSYAQEAIGNKHYVLDFFSGTYTRDMKIFTFAEGLAQSMAEGMDDVYGFIDFLGQFDCDKFGAHLESAWYLYRLITHEELSDDPECFEKMFGFMGRCRSEALKSDGYCKILSAVAGLDGLPLGTLRSIIPVLYKNADIMIYTIHDLVLGALTDHSAEDPDGCFGMMEDIREKTESHYKLFLDFFRGDDTVDLLLNEIQGCGDEGMNRFFGVFILRNFRLERGLSSPTKLTRVLRSVIKNVINCGISCDVIIEMLGACGNNADAAADIISEYCCGQSVSQTEQFGRAFGRWMNELDEPVSAAIQKKLIADSRAVSAVVILDAMCVAESKKPLDTLVSIYDRQFRQNPDMKDTDISPMVEALLDADSSGSTAAELMGKIPSVCIGDEKTVRRIAAAYNDMSMKQLMKISGKNTRSVVTVLNMCARNGILGSYDRLKAIFAQLIMINSVENIGIKLGELTKNVGEYKISLEKFDKSDYNEYVEGIMGQVFEYICHSGNISDLVTVIKFTYHPRYFGDFCNAAVSELKKLRKSDMVKWYTVNAMFTAFIDSNKGSGAAEEMNEIYSKASKKYDAGDVSKIAERAKQFPKEDAALDVDLERQEKKRSALGDKLGNIFSRKA